MKKGGGTEPWDANCEQAFTEVKAILTNPPIMNRPHPGGDLQIYLGMSAKAISIVLVQEQPESHLIYFVSRTLQEAEIRYQQVEKVALALKNVARRHRPYFQSHQVIVQTDYPILKILRKPDPIGRMVG